jgi:hypothetical protein
VIEMKLLFLLWVFSPFGIYSIGRKQQAPCDESNRINKIILLWFAFTRLGDLNNTIVFRFNKLSQWEMIKLCTFSESDLVHSCPWLKSDMWERLQ